MLALVLVGAALAYLLVTCLILGLCAVAAQGDRAPAGPEADAAPALLRAL